MFFHRAAERKNVEMTKWEHRLEGLDAEEAVR